MFATAPIVEEPRTARAEDGCTPASPATPCVGRLMDTNGLDAFALSGDGVVILSPALLHPLVNDLLAGNFASGETETLMANLRQQIEAGGISVANQLAGLVMMQEGDNPSLLDAQCLAIEILAATQMPQLARQMHAVVRRALTSSNTDLQFAAVAALSDLSRLQREVFRPLVEQLAHHSSDLSVASASRALLAK